MSDDDHCLMIGFGKVLKKEWAVEILKANEEQRIVLDRQKLQTHMETTGSRDYIAAAKNGFFGKLTRHVEDWKPDRLLLRRLNLSDPFELRPFVVDMTLHKEGTSNFDSRLAEVFENAGYKVSAPLKQESFPTLSVEAELKQNETNDLSNQTTIELSERPSIDLLRSIFADVDDEGGSAFPNYFSNPTIQPAIPEVASLDGIMENRLPPVAAPNEEHHSSTHFRSMEHSSEGLDFAQSRYQLESVEMQSRKRERSPNALKLESCKEKPDRYRSRSRSNSSDCESGRKSKGERKNEHKSKKKHKKHESRYAHINK